ncbi:MAG TPA: type 4a pilus biogenesis protein PilO [Bryobacteraceae bacterium]|jgi:Tfp pilus assembly protein PilO|nr:type 4a pilus biogenesis protein PilO [Bryobacteraceae bacterium]
MPRSFNGAAGVAVWWRVALGALLLAAIGAAWIVMYPPGGSADELQRQLAALEAQAAAKRALLASTRQHVAAVEQGRTEGDKFLNQYFLGRRTAYSTLLSELVDAADRAKIKPKEHAYATEPIEGSDSLSMMSISANYEGTYANLMRFVHEIDRSPRLLIIEALNAAPEQSGGTLNISMKIDTFVRDDGSAQ